MKPVDRRSVAELLLEAEQTARRLLYDAPAADAAAMVLGWSAVVTAASDFWHALPGRLPSQAGHPPADLMDELDAAAASLWRAFTRRQAARDEQDDMTHIADLFDRATQLVRKYPLAAPLSDAQHDDLLAARVRTIHTLYLAAHSASVSIGTTVRSHAGGNGSHFPLRLMLDAHRRLTASEQLAGSHISWTYPEALTGQHRDALDRHRFDEALATWNVAAHRALAAPPTARTLSLVADQESFASTAVQALWRTAAATGHVDISQYRTRLSSTLDQVESAWAELSATWAALTPRTDPLAPPDLRVAASELRAAVRELIHDRVGPAHPDVLTARTDMPAVVASLQHQLATSVELAHAFRDASSRPQHVQVDARAALGLIDEHIRQGQGIKPHPRADDDVRHAAGLPPRDLAVKHSTPVSEGLARILLPLAHDAVRAAVAASSAGTGITAPALARSVSDTRAAGASSSFGTVFPSRIPGRGRGSLHPSKSVTGVLDPGPRPEGGMNLQRPSHKPSGPRR